MATAAQRQRRLVAVLLLLLALSGCAPATTPPTVPALPSPTPTPGETTPAPPPTPSPSPTTRTPSPLGLVRLWRTATDDTVWSIGLCDVQGDGRPEAWATSYDHRFYLLNATGEISWSYPTTAPLYTALAADLDDDRRPEFLLGGDDSTVYALSNDGSLRWAYPAAGRVTHLASGDVDGDRQDEVVAATWDGFLHVIGPAGQTEQRLDLAGMPSALAVNDINSDGTEEIVVGTEAGQVLVFARGKMLWQHDLQGPVRGVIPADLDGDGHREVLAASRNGLVAWIAADGTPRWAQRVDGTIVTLAGLARGQLVLLGRADGLAALHLRDGQPAWTLPTRQGVWSLALLEGAAPIIAAGTDGGEILLVDLQGQARGGIQLPSRVHGLAGGDLDGDGAPELLARSGNWVYAFRPAERGETGEAAPTVLTMPRWPETSPLPPLAEGRISLLAVGDTMLSNSIEERMRAYGPDYPFQAMAALIRQADIAVGDLECVLAQGGAPAAKPYVFRAHPEMAAGLAAAGFDVISLANNHTLDYGPAGLTETVSALEAAGIQPVGAGLHPADPVVVEAGGIRVAFLARNVVESAQAGVAWATSEESLRQEIRQAKAQSDVLVLLLNAGLQYTDEVTAEQRKWAHAAVEAGAALVIGHHTHSTQETERYHDAIIAYGLGDFVSDIDVVDSARDGAILRAVLTKEGVVRVDWIPTRIVDDVQPRPLAAAGGQVEVRPLLVQTSEPLPPPPVPRATYVLSATVDPAGLVQVQEEVGFPNTSGEPLEELVFYVFPNAYTGTFSLQSVQVTQGEQVLVPSYILAGTTLRLFLPEQLRPGEAVTASMSFSLDPPLLQPLTWPPYNNLGRSADRRAVQLGHWYPQLVPYRHGYGWQTWSYQPVGDPFYADLADYRAVITAPAGYTVFGGGERRQEEKRWYFHLDAVRDFAALAGRNYLQEAAEVDGIQVVSAFRREHAVRGREALEEATRALALFQERYGPYPYSTFLLVEGDMNGGMEYGAMGLVGSPFYLDESAWAAATLQSLVVHELAHQWWYGVVGNDAVHEPWLDESLARYSEVLYYEAFNPKAVEWWWSARIDQWNPSGPLDATIYDFAETADYVHNLYGQGAHFMQDLRTRLGDGTFFRFLQRYYRENAWKRVTRLDFFHLLEEETGSSQEDLRRAYFQKW